MSTQEDLRAVERDRQTLLAEVQAESYVGSTAWRTYPCECVHTRAEHSHGYCELPLCSCTRYKEERKAA